jgi:quercetin dioxygenase-like cupin family protein
MEILSLTLEKGSVLPDHTSPRDAFLIVLEGTLDFYIDGKTFHLQRFEDFSFPKDRMHKVIAREDARFLIIR